MVKVIGTDPKVYKTITCRKCASMLEYLPIDVKEYSCRDYSGGSDGKEWIVCPTCNNEVIIRAW